MSKSLRRRGGILAGCLPETKLPRRSWQRQFASGGRPDQGPGSAEVPERERHRSWNDAVWRPLLGTGTQDGTAAAPTRISARVRGQSWAAEPMPVAGNADTTMGASPAAEGMPGSAVPVEPNVRLVDP